MASQPKNLTVHVTSEVALRGSQALASGGAGTSTPSLVRSPQWYANPLYASQSQHIDHLIGHPDHNESGPASAGLKAERNTTRQESADVMSPIWVVINANTD